MDFMLSAFDTVKLPGGKHQKGIRCGDAMESYIHLFISDDNQNPTEFVHIVRGEMMISSNLKNFFHT